MSLDRAPVQADVLATSANFCDGRVPESSIYALLHRECHRLFPDEMFADLFTSVGRRSVPPRIVSVVMVLQRLGGLSDREAVEHFAFDLRWKYAAGGLDFDYPSFAHTVLVDMRARLAASDHPDRIFEVSLGVAREAGLVGRRRVLDSTPVYDAVATMDTVTLIRSAVRGLLRVADADLGQALRGVLTSGDEYATAAKPVIDWDDPGAREALVDSRARDGQACLRVLDGQELGEAVEQAARLLATVLGQDLQADGDGVFRIARRVAKDRVISTVDPDARHGRKTSARGFDGYKGHAAVDPDSELVTGTRVTPGNVGDAAVAKDLIEDLFEEPGGRDTDAEPVTTAAPVTDTAPVTDAEPDDLPGPQAPTVYGDSAYGTAEFQEYLDEHGVDSRCKTQPPSAAGGMFTKDAFGIDLEADTVTCPAGVTTPIQRDSHGDGTARFGPACAGCPLREQCTNAPGGRSVAVGRHEAALATARARAKDPAWAADYRATRPKVERKLGHLMRRRHGGRRARVRGVTKVGADFSLLAGAHNLARMATLGVRSTRTGWAAVPG